MSASVDAVNRNEAWRRARTGASPKGLGLNEASQLRTSARLSAGAPTKGCALQPPALATPMHRGPGALSGTAKRRVSRHGGTRLVIRLRLHCP